MLADPFSVFVAASGFVAALHRPNEPNVNGSIRCRARMSLINGNASSQNPPLHQFIHFWFLFCNILALCAFVRVASVRREAAAAACDRGGASSELAKLTEPFRIGKVISLFLDAETSPRN